MCRLIKFTSALTVNVEPVYLWLIQVHLGRNDDCVGEMLKEYVGQARSEVGPVDVDAPELGQIDFLAAGTVDLEPRSLEGVAQTNGEHLLLVAKGARAEAIDALEIFLVNLGQTARGDYVAAVDQAVHIAGLLVELQEVLIGQVFLIGGHWGEYHLNASLELLLVWESFLQAIYVEGISYEIFIDINKEFVAL